MLGEIEMDELKTKVIPALFANPVQLGEYGKTETQGSTLDEYSSLVESGSVSALAGKIGEIIENLAAADPQKLAKKPTRVEIFFGAAVERQVRYQVARKGIDTLLEEAESIAQRVRDTLSALNALMLTHEDERNRLIAHIQAGQEFLDENPDVGAAVDGDISFDRPRERFARKLANLSTLLSSHEMSITQMKLTRAQAVDMLDRFNETANVLVPVWRQHALTLITTKNMHPDMIADATRAHKALMLSLSKSLEGIEK